VGLNIYAGMISRCLKGKYTRKPRIGGIEVWTSKEIRFLDYGQICSNTQASSKR